MTPSRDHGSSAPLDQTTFDNERNRRPPYCVSAHDARGSTPQVSRHLSLARVSFQGCGKKISRTPSRAVGMNISEQYCQSHKVASEALASFGPAFVLSTSKQGSASE